MPPLTRTVFLSHEWGVHRRVVALADVLHAAGVTTWLDEQQMAAGDNFLDAMANGLARSDVVVVLLTQRYLDKVASGDPADNARREFMQAVAFHGDKLLFVRYEPGLSLTKGATLPATVQMAIAAQVWVDVSADLPTQHAQLVRAIARHGKGGRSLATTRPPRLADASAWRIVQERSSRPDGAPPAMRVAGAAVVAAATEPRAGGPSEAQKERVVAAVRKFRGTPMEGPTFDALDELVRSVFGPRRGAEVAALPLCERLALVERELGTVAA